MYKPSKPPCRALTKSVLVLCGVGALCGLALACGYRWVGANPLSMECMLPVENLSNEVGAGQVFDLALRSRLGKAGGLSREGSLSEQGCLRARLKQVSREPLTVHNSRITHFRLMAVVELSLDKEGFGPIRVVQSEEFSYGADVLLTEAALRAALVRLADKTAQKGFEQMHMQWR
ncbi:MAG: LPS assembly lipoprotein LptE [Cystobacterineae bacterium]|nr:LPS assembly lipoprotein LptE [Cystobacterineae bacterium]